MLLHFSGQRLYRLTGILEVRMAQDVKQPIVAKLLLLTVFCLVQTVGIDEEWSSLDAVYLLTLVFQPSDVPLRYLG